MHEPKKTEDRRTAPRFDPSVIPAFRYISRIGGSTIKLVNISRGGALVESRERISVGAGIALRLTTDEDVHFIKGRIVRSRTSPRMGRVFQSAIAFREDLTIIPASTDAD